VATWEAEESYGEFIRRLTIRDGLKVEMLRFLFNIENSANDYKILITTSATAAKLIKTDPSTTLVVCLDQIMNSSHDYNRTMQSAMEHMLPEVPWSEVGNDLVPFDVHHRKSQHSNSMDASVKQYLGGLVVDLDTQYFNGSMMRAAAQINCGIAFPHYTSTGLHLTLLGVGCLKHHRPLGTPNMTRTRGHPAASRSADVWVCTREAASSIGRVPRTVYNSNHVDYVVLGLSAASRCDQNQGGPGNIEAHNRRKTARM
jgi:hypothetical protein